MAAAVAAAAAAVAVAAVRGAAAAGMSVHNEVGYRASLWFRSADYPEYEAIAVDYPEWRQPGAFFPDWGYSCGGFDNEAEDAHWPPFWNATVEYIREVYPKPWTEDVHRLLAFSFGFLAHAGADTPWHSLGHAGGIIQAMEFIEFGSYGDAHTMADVAVPAGGRHLGGEFVLKHAGDLDYVANEWNTPAEDLAAIYHRTGRTGVTADDISNCMRLGFLGITANRVRVSVDMAAQLAGEVLFGYAKDSPLLIQNLQNYYLGAHPSTLALGLNDAATWTQDCWGDFVRWLETDEARRPACTMMENHWGRGLPAREDNRSDLLLKSEAILAAYGLAVKTSLEDGVARATLVRLDGGDVDAFWRELEAKRALKELREAGQGTGLATCQSILEVATRAFVTNEPLAQLGHSLVSGDFNNDGRADLVIGAPFYVGQRGNAQRGAVFVISDATVDMRSEAGGAPVIEQVEQAAAQTITGHDNHGRFGYALAVVDLNRDGIDDLAVGAPTTNHLDFHYDGRVFVYFGSPSGLSVLPDLTIHVEQIGEPPSDPGASYTYKATVFGDVLLGADVDGDGYADLIVGAALAEPTITDYQRGEVFVYLAAEHLEGTVDHRVGASLIFAGQQNHQWFGAAVAFGVFGGRRLLLVGAPSHGTTGALSTGRVLAFDIAAGSQSAPVFTITGTQRLQRFGSDLAVGDFYGTNTTLLAVASSAESTDESWQAGTLRVINIAGLTGDVTVDDTDVYAALAGDQNAALLGWGRPALTDAYLWSAEPLFGLIRSEEAKLETGRVLAFRLGSEFPRNNGTVAEPAGEVASLCFLGDAPKGRLGRTLAEIRGSNLLAVAAPQSYLQSRLSGAVFLVPQ